MELTGAGSLASCAVQGYHDQDGEAIHLRSKYHISEENELVYDTNIDCAAAVSSCRSSLRALLPARSGSFNMAFPGKRFQEFRKGRDPIFRGLL